MASRLISSFSHPFFAGHFQGGSYSLYKYWTDFFQNQIITIPDDVTVITCYNNYDNAILAQQLTKNKCQFIASTHKGAWSNPLKIKLILDGLTKANTDTVIISDANDVLFTGSPIIIPETTIYNATKNNYPMEKIEEEHDTPSQFRYFNAGLCIGNKEYLIKLYTYAAEIANTIHNPQESEQLIIRNALKKYPVDVDYEGKYFQTFSCTHVERRSENEFSVV